MPEKYLPLPNRHNRQRVIVVRPDRVGDVIISTSCFVSLRDTCALYFAASKRMRPFLESHPDLHEFVTLPEKNSVLRWRRVKHIYSVFSKIGATAIVHLHPDRDCYLAAHFAGIPVRIGYHVGGYSWALTHSIPDARLDGKKHEASYNFDLLRLIGAVESETLVPNVHLSTHFRARLERRLSWPLAATKFAVINPSAFSQIARWPAARFAKVAQWIRDTLAMKIVIIGESAKDKSVREMIQCLGQDRGEVENLAGRTDLAELGWLLKHAQVLVTRDTGPSHLAAAVGCPVVVLFGRTTPLYGPTRWKPLSRNSVIVASSVSRRAWETQTRYWKRSFAAISVEDVQKAVSQCLSQVATPERRLSPFPRQERTSQRT